MFKTSFLADLIKMDSDEVKEKKICTYMIQCGRDKFVYQKGMHEDPSHKIHSK